MKNEIDFEIPQIFNTKLSWHIMPEKIEYINVLHEQGVSNFDPIAFYNESNKGANKIEDQNKLSKKNKKKNKISNSAKKIIAENIKKRNLVIMNEDNKNVDIFKKDINTFNLNDISRIIKSLQTESIRIKLKCWLLDYYLKKDLNTICHLLFFSLQDENDDNKELKIYKSSICEKYKEKYKNKNMIEVQMNNMSSYLDPLDPLSINKMKLDDWQLDVFKKIQDNKNIMICAPTSAGKTVCSTYCAVLGNKTLFVVPSDELARQVGGIFRKLQNIIVKIVTNKEYFDDGNYNVLVGTPIKLEEYLVLNKNRKTFSYAIYDEWHMINSDEGGSLENLFKLMTCPFLILSATLENPIKLKNWMEDIKKQEVYLVEYKKRFIVQQRYIWNDNNLVHLHPLACADIDFVKSDNFLKNDISFTPRDSLDLYYKINKNIDDMEFLYPANILKKGKWDKITLTETITVEKELKKFLNKLAKEDGNKAKDILDTYKIEEKYSEFNLVKLIKLLIAKKMCPAIFFKINPINCLNIFKYIVNQLKEEQDKKYPFHYDDLELRNEYFLKYQDEFQKTKEKEKLSKDVDIEAHFKTIETNLENKLLQELKVKYKQIVNKRIKKIKDTKEISKKEKDFYENYYLMELEKVENQNSLFYIDKDRPHPEFCFNNMGLDSNEMRSIKRELCKTTKEHIDYTHPFMIGIERGIIPYFKDMELHFQIIAQTLFSQKKIPIVISDESLGYGINLPIRTVVLLGEPNIETIDPVIANQMSGRSGRRGLDNEGNIVYVGVNWKNILRGKFYKLEGKNPINKYSPLPFYFKRFNKEDISSIFSNTLYNYENNLNYDSKQKQKEILGYLSNTSKKKQYALLIWSCRFFGSNSFYLPQILDLIENDDQYKIIHYLLALFNTIESKLEEDNLYDIFDKGKYIIYKYDLYFNAYKRATIENNDELKSFKLIANLISIIHINYENINKNFAVTLEVIFNRIKEMMKHKLF
tara:strand:+ start:271 stop:3216 length:2946 start_codon:yes stop_codon:yes gene_type:complete